MKAKKTLTDEELSEIFRQKLIAGAKCGQIIRELKKAFALADVYIEDGAQHSALQVLRRACRKAIS